MPSLVSGPFCFAGSATPTQVWFSLQQLEDRQRRSGGCGSQRAICPESCRLVTCRGISLVVPASLLSVRSRVPVGRGASRCRDAAGVRSLSLSLRVSGAYDRFSLSLTGVDCTRRTGRVRYTRKQVATVSCHLLQRTASGAVDCAPECRTLSSVAGLEARVA